MKKILLVFVVVIALMGGFCIGRMNRRAEKEQREITMGINENTKQTAVSSSAVRATRADASQNEGKPEKVKVRYVTDLVGGKRVIRLGDIDLSKKGEIIIPRKGGEMVRVFQDAAIAGSGDTPLSVSSNSKYIYYIDKAYKVRRVNKKKMKNIVVSNVKEIDVKCTEKNIYVKKYKEELVPGYWDDTTDASLSDDPNSSAVYCMDLDGKNREKIAD